MELAPWRSLLARNIHIHRNRPEARFLQLATIAVDGYPANRTVVFRGFLPDSNRLKFVCDRRSQKIEQIRLNPLAEACWYFPKTREQFRFRGELSIIDADLQTLNLQAARMAAWQELSNAARVQYAWADPRQPRAKDPMAFLPPQPSIKFPLDTFCLLLLEPLQVDHLELRGTPQNRSLYIHEDNIYEDVREGIDDRSDRQQMWSVRSVNP
jgi:pyridoxamine 5'-phosphate oxidase